MQTKMTAAYQPRQAIARRFARDIDIVLGSTSNGRALHEWYCSKSNLGSLQVVQQCRLENSTR